jgi:hypothetical protein
MYCPIRPKKTNRPEFPVYLYLQFYICKVAFGSDVGTEPPSEAIVADDLQWGFKRERRAILIRKVHF